jgi:hypothetical protein
MMIGHLTRSTTSAVVSKGAVSFSIVRIDTAQHRALPETALISLPFQLIAMRARHPSQPLPRTCLPPFVANEEAPV